jgi:hypothetical protein
MIYLIWNLKEKTANTEKVLRAASILSLQDSLKKIKERVCLLEI